MARTVVALFDDPHDARRAVEALVNEGFPREDVSVAANRVHDEDSGTPHAALGTEVGGLRDQNIGAGGSVRTDGTRMPGVTGTATTTGPGRLPTEEPDTKAGEGAGVGAGVGVVLGGITGLLLGATTLAIPGGPILLMGPLATTLVGAGVGAVAGSLLGALVGAGIPEEHAHAYAEGVRRGGTLVLIRTPDARADDAAGVLGRFGPVDIEQRSAAWREAGWSGYRADAEPFGRDQIQVERSRYANREPNASQGVRIHPWERGNDDALAQGSPESRVQPDTGRRMSSQASDRPAQNEFSGTHAKGPSWDEVEPQFRRDFDARFGTFGNSWKEYEPAYRHGYEMSRDPRFSGRKWPEVEASVRAEYERRHGATDWSRMKAPIQYAFVHANPIG